MVHVLCQTTRMPLLRRRLFFRRWNKLLSFISICAEYLLHPSPTTSNVSAYLTHQIQSARGCGERPRNMEETGPKSYLQPSFWVATQPYFPKPNNDLECLQAEVSSILYRSNVAFHQCDGHAPTWRSFISPLLEHKDVANRWAHLESRSVSCVFGNLTQWTAWFFSRRRSFSVKMNFNVLDHLLPLAKSLEVWLGILQVSP